MICPFCGYKNIAGSDECESCHEDLASLDGVVPKTRIEKILMEDPVSRLQPRTPVVVGRKTSVLEAVKKMNAGKMGCALVADEKGLEGILTERDIVFKILDTGKDLAKIAVETVMTPNPVFLAEEDSLAYAVNKMALGSYRHIPITRDGKPIGIISVRDVLRYLSKLFP